jgi:serine protease Do
MSTGGIPSSSYRNQEADDMTGSRTYFLGALLAFSFAVLACSGGDDEPKPTATPAETSTETPSTGSVGSFEDVQQAVIQIVAQGTFRDPEVGFSNGSGAGSGFIISPDGLAVTNNHVVAGAATLEVFIGGDDTRSYNASILGVSECNDLALIDINESEPLPYLSWFEEEITPGIDVYAAGFPLGDPEFTLTRGIVSKAKAGGDLTGTSSIDHTIEHDANIQPGNSGGPLVSTDGRVVGINYAGGAVATTTAQFYAIAWDLAEPVIEQLKNGDFESLGINGWAIYDETSGLTGIWVAGVKAGSPASDANLLPGDIITSMNGLPVGTDGTFKDYCDVIRTAGDNAISVEVLRYDTGELLRGEINGNKPVEPAFSIAGQVQDQVGNDTTGDVTTGYSGYMSITDDTGSLIVEVPNEWTDIDTAPFDLEGEAIPYIGAAPDLQSMFDTYDTSGMEFALFGPVDDLFATVDIFAPEEGDCIDIGYYDYSDPVFTGQYHAWDDCGGVGTVYVSLAAVPDDGSYTAVMLVQLTNEADFEALDQLFATFDVLE